MKIFIDSANVEDIAEAASFGVVDGVTTNPSLIAKEGADPPDHTRYVMVPEHDECAFGHDIDGFAIRGPAYHHIAPCLVWPSFQPIKIRPVDTHFTEFQPTLRNQLCRNG